MKRDIDRLMEEREIDVAVVEGEVKGNATLFYVINGAKLSHATVIKRKGQEPVLLCGTMEREEAEESGLKVVDTSKYDFTKILKEADGDRLRAAVEYYRIVFEEFGVSGNVAFYGKGDTGSSLARLRALDAAIPDINVIGEYADNVFITARATKEPYEVDRIREVGRLTCEIVRHIVDYWKSHRLEADTLMKPDGKPLTIGDCKAEIRLSLAARSLIEEVDTILAIGRDAGIPHSRGNDSDPITTGKTIVFDIFPQEQGAGYFFDMTRTFVLGSASQEISDAYAQLGEIHEAVLGSLKQGERAGRYQEMVCDFLEERGHETPRTNPQVRNGYVHSLGHGIGLNVHENPRLSDAPGVEDTLESGHVFTVEPGIYYPDKGWGMRIEDVVYVREDGTMENLTKFPKDLIVEL